MAEARSDATTIDTEAACNANGASAVPKVYIFRATGSVLKFPGFRTIYMESKDDGDDEDGKGPSAGAFRGRDT